LAKRLDDEFFSMLNFGLKTHQQLWNDPLGFVSISRRKSSPLSSITRPRQDADIG
jgi:hypothetical protein